VTAEQSAEGREYIRRALELCVHIGLAILLVGACLLILRPFLPLVVWGTIIAISIYPGFRKLQRALDGHGALAAVLCTTLLLAVLVVPVVLLTKTVVEGVHNLVTHLQNGTLAVPPPPPSVATWFVIGPPLMSLWSAAATNLSTALAAFAPQIKVIIPILLSVSAGIGLTIFEFVLSILISGVLLANAHRGAAISRSLADRLFGDQGAEFEALAASTVRSVTTGVLGVALIQSLFAALGFLVVGLPGAGLWGLIFLIAAVLQVGGVVLVPAVVYVFAIASTSKAVVFLIWCVLVGLMNNVLGPLLMGRGTTVPMVVIFLGAIGGFLTMGIIGLFVGAIILSVGYKLFLAWLYGASQVAK
jgi:predicted PurR-regulated permease PerM